MKKIVFLFSLCCFYSFAAVAQRTDKADPDDMVFTKVETEAHFPGGEGAFRTFLEKTLNSRVPDRNGAPVGVYNVVVRFIVGKDGAVSDVSAETNFGYGMEKEVIRVIKRSQKWEPAIQNGVPVKAYRRQPVTFVVSTN